LTIVAIVVGLFVMFGLFGGARLSQYEDDEQTIYLGKSIEIYETRAEVLLDDFSVTLLATYPEYVSSIFESIGPEGVAGALGEPTLFAVMYPEIGASDLFKEYVSQSRSVNDAIYETQIERQRTLADMRVRERNPWLLFVPRLSHKCE